MTHAASIHIGLNSVDPNHYQGWSGQLTACEFDAKDMAELATKSKFPKPHLLLTKQATAAAVTKALADAAKELATGGILLLTYSGHGGQVQDSNHDEPDGYDETWVLYDRQLVDDELYAMYSKFKPGVRILVLSDSCHSGSVVKAMPPAPGRYRLMPPDVAKKVEQANAELYRSIQKQNPAAEKVDVAASVLLISGCQDNQLSLDGDKNGLFTGTLKTVWKNGDFKGSYKSFKNHIGAKMPPSQSPNFFTTGARNLPFERQQPFTI